MLCRVIERHGCKEIRRFSNPVRLKWCIHIIQTNKQTCFSHIGFIFIAVSQAYLVRIRQHFQNTGQGAGAGAGAGGCGCGCEGEKKRNPKQSRANQTTTLTLCSSPAAQLAVELHRRYRWRGFSLPNLARGRCSRPLMQYSHRNYARQHTVNSTAACHIEETLQGTR